MSALDRLESIVGTGDPEPFVCRTCGATFDVEYYVCPACDGFSVERRFD